jgi:hypothetical protein
MDTNDSRLSVFSPIWTEINEFKQHNAELKFEYRTPSGEKMARSHIAKLRKVKTRIADAHKIAKEEALNVCKVLDGAKRDLLAEIEAMIDVHQAPLNQIEAEVAELAEAEQRKKDEAERIRLADLERREADVRRAEQEKADKERSDRLIQEGIERGQRAAAQAEADRLAAEALRKDDEAHRWEIQKQIHEDLEAAGVEGFLAVTIVELIHTGKIRNVKIQY